MTAEEFRAFLERHDMRPAHFAELVSALSGLTMPRSTPNRWAEGSMAMSPAAVALVRLLEAPAAMKAARALAAGHR